MDNFEHSFSTTIEEYLAAATMDCQAGRVVDSDEYDDYDSDSTSTNNGLPAKPSSVEGVTNKIQTALLRSSLSSSSEEDSEEEEEERLLRSKRYSREDKLVGRYEETQDLRKALYRSLVGPSLSLDGHFACAFGFDEHGENNQNQQPEFWLVSGERGQGKTALVEEALQNEVVRTHKGLFLRAKFHPPLQQEEDFARQMPYQAVLTALNHLATDMQQAMMGEDEEDNGVILGVQENDEESVAEDKIMPNKNKNQVAWALRENILSHLSGRQCQILCSFVPAFSSVLGVHSAPNKDSSMSSSMASSCASSGHATDPLKPVLIKVFQAIASPEHPVVLFLDDLQWAGPASLVLLEALIAASGTMDGFMLVGTCCDSENDSSPAHLFLQRLQAKQEIRIRRIQVGPLSPEATTELVAAQLQAVQRLCVLLANLIHKKSKGNVLYTLHLLRTLQEEGILVRHNDENNTTQQWMWYEDLWKTRFQDQDVDIVELIKTFRLLQLSGPCQHILTTAACLGAEVDFNILRYIFSDGEDRMDIQDLIEEATAKRLLTYDSKSQTLTFTNDCIQQAAYSLLPQSEKARARQHLWIGRSLHRNLPCELQEQHLFLIVHQMTLGRSLIESEEERHVLARLCLRVGTKLMVASDASRALHYFDFGVRLLETSHLLSEYDLSGALLFAKAEAECCLGDYAKMNSTLNFILAYCRSSMDQAKAATIKLRAKNSQSSFSDVMASGIEALEQLGVRLPSKPRKIYLSPDLKEVKKLLASKSDNDILKLPSVVTGDPRKEAAMTILNQLQWYALPVKPDIFPLLVLRSVKLTLKYGICDQSCLSFAFYAVMLSSMEEYDDAYRISQLAIRLLDQCDSDSRSQLQPRVMYLVYSITMPDSRMPKLLACTDEMETAVAAAADIDDAECAAWASLHLFTTSYTTGETLSVVLEKQKTCAPLMEGRQDGTLWHAVAQLEQKWVRNLMVAYEGPASLKPEIEVTAENEHVVGHYRAVETLAKLQLAYHFGDIQHAMELAHENPYGGKVWKTPALETLRYFYEAMTLLEAAHHSKTRRINTSKAKKLIKKLKKLSKHYPSTVLDKLYILKGEMYALQGNRDSAILWYVKGVKQAAREGHVTFQALAYERAAVAYRRLIRNIKDVELAKDLIKLALNSYARWEAVALVDHLKRKHNLSV